MFSSYEVTEGLLIAVLGAHLALLVFVAWQIIYFSQCLRYYIRRLRRLVIGEMDCDELIDELMSDAEQRQGAGAGLAEGAPPAAAPAGGRAATPDVPEGQGKNGCKNTVKGSPRSRREANPASSDWWSVGKHLPPIKSTL